jgi:protein gp37
MDQQPGTLEECERRIEEAERNSYIVRGTELGKIHADQSWRNRYNYQTFDEYCTKRWELSSSHAYELIKAASFAEKVRDRGLEVPAREFQIRILVSNSRLSNDDDRITVWRDVLAAAKGGKIVTDDVNKAIARFIALREKDIILCSEWNEMPESDRATVLGRIGKKGLNKQENAEIEWADWSWNPITGCLHGCPYCYARDIALDIYPPEVKFLPTIWLDRLTAPQNQKVPADIDISVARKNIFTCSMADLFGRWVPKEWIQRVLAEVEANPQWNFLFLTKFPKRMAEFDIPPNAWMGTTVDLQARVANAEKAFEHVKAGVRWLSIEPMLQPLQFKRLDLFDWIVIGGASPSKATDGSPETPAWTVPIDWIIDLYQQAREAGCKVYFKTNSGLSGYYTRIREYPGHEAAEIKLPPIFNYLGNIPSNEQIG